MFLFGEIYVKANKGFKMVFIEIEFTDLELEMEIIDFIVVLFRLIGVIAMFRFDIKNRGYSWGL